jgi:hypothetical protein
MMESGLTVASGLAIKMPSKVRTATDIYKAVQQCIAAKLSPDGMPQIGSPQQGEYFNAAAKNLITKDQAARLQRGFNTEAMGTSAGLAYYNYGMTPAVAARALAKIYQSNKIKYPSFQVVIDISGRVTFKNVMYPALPFDVLPPTQMPLMPNPFEFLRPGPYSPFILQSLDRSVMLASSLTSMTDYGSLPDVANQYFAGPSKNAFSFATDMLDGNINTYTRGMPYDLGLARSLTFQAFDKTLSGVNYPLMLQQFRYPEICTNPRLMAALQSSGFHKALRAYAKAQALAFKPDKPDDVIIFDPKKVRSPGQVQQDIDNVMDDNSPLDAWKIIQMQSIMCSPKTRTALFTLPGTVRSDHSVGPIVKALSKDLVDVTRYQVPRRFYAPNYSRPNTTFKDKVQFDSASQTKYLEHLNNAAGTKLPKHNYLDIYQASNSCRDLDITDTEAKDEKLILAGFPAKEYNRWTAFASCPAYSPLSPGSFLGQLLNTFVFPIIQGTTGIPMKIEKFEVRRN